MQTAIVCFNKENPWCKDFIHSEINHCSIAFETKPSELVHLTWTGKRIEVMAGAIARDDYIKQLREQDVIVVEYPIREDFTPCIGPFTCVSMVKRCLGLGPFSMHLLTPYQLCRHLRR